MALKLFFDAMSQPARSVMLFLKCNDVAYSPQLVDIASGGNRSEEFLKINPYGRVPAIEHNGMFLFESVAILKYLSAVYPIADHWYPKDLQQRAKIDEYLAWHHTSLRMGAAMTFRNGILMPLMGLPAKDNSKYIKILNQSVEMFDNYFLKNTEYISGNEISIADLMALTEFSQLEIMGEKAPPLTGKVEEWMKRCKNETEPHYSEVHTVHSKVKARVAKSKL